MNTLIFVVLALSLCLTNAAFVNPIDTSIKTVEAFRTSLNAKVDDVSVQISREYDDVIIQPVVRVESSVNVIESRRQESDECVDQEINEIQNIIPNLESSLDLCAQAASEASVALSVDILSASTEIGFDLVNLVKSVRKCSQYTNSTLKSACYANQLIKAKQLLDKSEEVAISVNTSFNEAFPLITMDFENCSIGAEQAAQAQVENINRNIDSCIAIIV